MLLEKVKAINFYQKKDLIVPSISAARRPISIDIYVNGLFFDYHVTANMLVPNMQRYNTAG